MSDIELGNIGKYKVIYREQFMHIITDDFEYKAFYPLKLEIRTPIKDFDIKLFKRNYTIENNSYQVMYKTESKNKRLGWMIPITSLYSIEHDFSENIHFLNYAKSAFIHLLIEIIEKNSIDELDIDLNKFYSENIHVFTYYIPNCSDIQIDNFFFSFFKNGFYNANIGDVKLNIDYPEKDSFVVKSYSNDIDNISYIKKLISKFMPVNNEAIFDFYYMYQIIELLINQIFLEKKDESILEMIDCDSASQIRESIHAMNDTLSEKKRIKLLFSDYISESKIDYREGLIQKVNDFFLSNNQYYKYTTIEDVIYKLRNLLIHNHYSIIHHEGLNEINSYIRNLIDLTISNFKKTS